MIAIICATMAGVTIVLSRSVNGYLSTKIGAYNGTFFNYFTGFIASFLLMMCVWLVGIEHLSLSFQDTDLRMFLGGMIGVFNILILNIVVSKISPVYLTLITFIAQLLSSIVIDYLIYDMFSLTRMIGCIIVFIGLILYQNSDDKIEE